MKTNKTRNPKLRNFLILLPIVIVVMMITEISYVINFNQKQHVVKSTDTDTDVSMAIAGRAGDANKWVKRDFELNGKQMDLNGQTMEGALVNGSAYEINEWSMRIDILDDCMINQFWCGTVEIHQNVKTDEKVQTLDLRNCSPEDVELDYLFEGDLLIPLSEGDYLIYYPSEKEGELPVDKNSQLTMGFIIYYFDEPDMSSYSITYSYNRHIRDGYNVYIIALLIAIWLILLLLYIVSNLTYKKAVKEMEIKKSGILCLSDMYSVIYMINLKTNELTPLVAEGDSEKLRPVNIPASEQLKGMFEHDSMDSFIDMALEFCDFSTLEQRLERRNTIAFEYISKNNGWCRTRFFAMDKNENEPLERVLFTIQNINEEKSEVEAVSHRAEEAEHENKAKSTFLANMSHEIRTPINTVIGLNTMILRESHEPAIKSYARNINSASNMLLSIINGILDISKLEADKMELVSETYSVRQLFVDVISMIKSRAEFNKLEFKYEIAENLPDKLYGDAVRLKQVIINLITNAAKYTDDGSVKLSVYGKIHDGMVHMLISVKDTGIGIHEADLEKLSQRFTRFDEKRNHSVEGTGIGLNLVTGILELMDSELHVISQYGKGSEFYFEIEQDVIDETPVGKIDLDDTNDDETEYQAMFTAPEAHVLVVDDNKMNLMVFEELLKETQLQIDAVSSGISALEKTKIKKYDIIFMDHMMPEMDGIETFKRIRSQSDGLNKDTPVIILTANAIKGAAEEYQKIGFDDFLAKPIDPDNLERMFMDYLDDSKVNKCQTKIRAKNADEMVLPVIPGVDVAFAVTHMGGLKNYLMVLKQFVTAADTDAEELSSYVDSIKADDECREVVKSFRIKVHAMKAVTNIMGAFQAFGLAAMLEDAAIHDNIKMIQDMTPYFLDKWFELKAAVETRLPEEQKDQDKPQGEVIGSMIHLLETSMKAYDIKNADAIMKKLMAYDWDDDEKELLKELEKAVTNLDSQMVVSISDKFKKMRNNNDSRM